MLFGGKVSMRFELVVKQKVGNFGGLANKSLNHRVLTADPEVFGHCNKFFVEFDEDCDGGTLEKLTQHLTHILDKHFFQFHSTQLLRVSGLFLYRLH